MALDDTVARPARPHDRFPGFDGVRALAALMVVVYHAVFFNTVFRTTGGSFLGTLNAGVWIFFVTSGFLLYLPVRGRRTCARRRRCRPARLRGPARRAHLPGVLVRCSRSSRSSSPRINIYGLHGFLLHTTLTQTYVHINPFVDGLPPAWSLVVEVSFYVFLPVYAAVIGALARGDGGRSRSSSPASRCSFAIGVVAIVAIGERARRAVGHGAAPAPRRVRAGHAARRAQLAAVGAIAPRPVSSASGARRGSWWTAALAALVAIPVVFRLDPLAAPSAVAGDRAERAAR